MIEKGVIEGDEEKGVIEGVIEDKVIAKCN